MDPGVCHDCLGALLTEEAGALRELEELLQHEHDVLVADNAAAIERTARTRQDKIGELARIEEQRRSLCTLRGYSPDKQGLEQLLTWCDPKGSLLPALRECAERGTRCRELNDLNGALVAARLKHVEARLAVLTGRSQPVTYTPGNSVPKSAPGRVLGAA